MASRPRAPKSRAPAHQNKWGFRHNKGSHKSKAIMSTDTSHLVCRSCADKLEWRKKYRKYKPLSAPATCSGCRGKTVKRAYHTLCEKCAGERGVCAKCGVPQEHSPDDLKSPAELAAEEAALQRRLKDFSEANRRTILRSLESGKELRPDLAAALYGTNDEDEEDDEDDDDDDAQDEEEEEEEEDGEGEEEGTDDVVVKKDGEKENNNLSAAAATSTASKPPEPRASTTSPAEEDDDDGQVWEVVKGLVAEVLDKVVQHMT